VRQPGYQFREWPDEFRHFFGDDFFDRFFHDRIPEGGFEQRGLGTGVIVREDGYILTNNHVVAGADEVNVTLSDERQLTAEVVGADEKTDLAVLKVAEGQRRTTGPGQPRGLRCDGGRRVGPCYWQPLWP